MDWDPTDQAKAKAFMLEKGSHCAMCGTAPWEWDEKQGGSRFAYDAVAVRCQGCYIKDAASDDTTRQAGVTIELHPTGTVESAKRQVALQEQAKRQAAKNRERTEAAKARARTKQR